MEPSAHVDTFARENLPPQDQWPVFLLESPDVAYPPRLNCATELLDRAVEAGHGERVAVWSDRDGTPQATTYRLLLERVNRAAHVLVEDMGLVPGNRILLRGPNTLEMAVAFLASLKAGLVVVPTMPLLRAKELKQIIDKARIAAALCDTRLVDELDACRGVGSPHFCPDLQQVVRFHCDDADSLDALSASKSASFEACDTAADDVCLIAFTSGTTGAPKGCMHFHRDVLAMCDLFPRHILKPTAADVFCGTPPLAFTFGLGGLLCFPLRVGASTVLIERLTPETLLQTVERYRATIMFTAPTFYRQMAPLVPRFDISSLKQTVSAGEALPDSTRTLWNAMVGKCSMSRKSALRRCLSRIWMPVSIEAASMMRLIRAPAGPPGSATTSPLNRPKCPSAFIRREVARKVISLASGWMRKRSGSALAGAAT